MITSYGTEFSDEVVNGNLKRIGGQIFRLLPAREEGLDWQKPLETLLVELLGMANLFSDRRDMLTLVAKLEGVHDADTDFQLFRRTIFECCNLINRLQQETND